MTEKWTDTEKTMIRARGDHAVTLVDFEDYSDWCIATTTTTTTTTTASGPPPTTSIFKKMPEI